MVRRAISDYLIELIQFFPVVGILGPRQVGKTTLAKMLVNELNQEVIYLDLELQEDLNKLVEPELYLKQHLDTCVILDEIQRMPELYPVLRGMIDKNRVPGRFILLGSASPELIRDSSETLAGRIAYQELTPFHLLEIGDVTRWREHWFRGGFPEAWLAPSQKLSRAWYRYFVQTYLERDLPQLGFPATATLTRKLWQMLAHFHGQLWNAQSFSSALEISPTTVKRYVDFLTDAFLVRQLQPFHANVKKRLVKSPKIYLRDSGILHFLTRIPDLESLHGHTIIGHSWEGYVVEQIAQVISEDDELYFYRTHSQTEMDLVVVRANQPIIGIEIKYSLSPKPSRGFQTAIEDLGTKENYIVIPEGESYNIRNGVRVISLAECLTTVF